MTQVTEQARCRPDRARPKRVEPVPRIEIGPGATVQGELHFEREVKLYVSDKATIAVTGTTPMPFTGDTPPQG